MGTGKGKQQDLPSLFHSKSAGLSILLFGASGMVGQGVLRECLQDAAVSRVVSVGRGLLGIRHPKLKEILHGDMSDFHALEDQLYGFDACFFCLGVSSAGMSEAAYSRITYGFATAAGSTLARLNPEIVLTYVSGSGTDSTERGRVMWARVKGKTENALLRLPVKAAYMFRPGIIDAIHGEKSKTTAYRIIYGLMRPVMPLLRRFFRTSVLTTEQIGKAMLRVVKIGATKRILEVKDIYALSQQ